jgi:hypothetical protein
MTTTDPDRCTEILEDGTIYTFSINKSSDRARELLERLWELEGQELDFDYTAAVFSLFVDSIDILTNSGWTTQDLITEVITHSAADDREDFAD